MRSSSIGLLGKVMAAALVIAACRTETDITLSVSPTAISLPAGGSASVVLTGSSSGEDGSWDVTAAVAGGLTVQQGAGTSTGSSYTVPAEISAPPSTPPGTYTVVFEANTANSREPATATLNVTVTQPPSFSVSCAPTISVTQGQGATAACTLTRTGGFTGGVTLDLLGAPTGCTGSFSPNPATGATSTLNVGCLASVPPGPYALTVRGTATGLTAQTSPVSLTVVAAQTPSFSLAVGLASVAVTRGQGGTNTITVTRAGGFTGSVTLALEGAPGGVTGSFNPNPATGATSTLSLTVADTVATGNYTLTVRGTAAGLTAQTATFTLAVSAPPANFSLAASPASFTVQAGSPKVTSTIAITRTNGFAGAVAFTQTTTAPAGVTIAFTPASTTGNSVSLDITVAGGVAAGTYTITVKGNSAGLAEQTATVALTVTAPTGNFSLAASPASFTVQAGSPKVTSTIAITRTDGFAGAVAFTQTTTAPAGVTIAFTPASTTGNSVSLDITAGDGVAAGTYTITVKGNSAGLAEQTATVTLTVTAPPSGGGSISWTFCPQTGVPTWLAVQDGNGAWSRVTPTTSGLLRTFTFTITQKGGVAWVELDDTDGSADLNVMYGSATELANAGGECEGSGAVKTVNGTVAGLGALGNAVINLGGGVTAVYPPDTEWSIADVLEGTVDLIASRAAVDPANPGAGPVTDALVIRRNLNPMNGATLPVINFDGGEKVTPERPALTITNPGGSMTASTSFMTANGETGLLGGGPLGASPYTYYAVPAAARQSGDLHILGVTSIVSSSGSSGEYRSVSKLFAGAGAQSVTFGSAAPALTSTVPATAPYTRPRAQFTNSAGYADLVVLYWVNGTGRENTAAVTIWEGYGLGLGIDYTLPDFSGVSGWNNTWGLEAAELQTNLYVSGWTSGGAPGREPFTDGGLILSAGRFGGGASLRANLRERLRP